MALEGQGDHKNAALLFMQAWNEAGNDFEKFTAAHYVARRQNSVEDKLKWDQIALNFALKLEDEGAKASFSSLYLNIGKCYEDLNKKDFALKNYELAFSFLNYLNDDGYGNLIRMAVLKGLERTKS